MNTSPTPAGASHKTHLADSRLASTLEAIDAANSQDPNLARVDGKDVPKELIYGQRMSAALAGFMADASETLQIACRAQHIRRWLIPRSDYPATRVGYLQWRKDLGAFHAEQTAAIMTAQGYQQASIDKVQQLLRKQGIKQDSEVQALEDVICLVFVQFYLTDFSHSQDPEKLNNIIRKTWAKMSSQGQKALLALDLDPILLATLKKALSD